ncbi:MAG: hypothetical protein ACKOCM_08985 [Cyanobacteriota bacterium]
MSLVMNQAAPCPSTPARAQAMGAFSPSTGAIVLPIGTSNIGRTSYGTSSANVMIQGNGINVPTLTFHLPEVPQPLLPEQLHRTPNPYAPGLGSFELERP